MKISIDPLEKAWWSLNKAMDRALREPGDLEVRDACIQRFEYTYELSIKTIKRYIEYEMPLTENVDQLNYRDLIRVAFEGGLVEQIEHWFQYREARNQTSHAYDEKKAEAVYQVLPAFVKSSKFLLQQFKQRLKPL